MSNHNPRIHRRNQTSGRRRELVETQAVTKTSGIQLLRDASERKYQSFFIFHMNRAKDDYESRLDAGSVPRKLASQITLLTAAGTFAPPTFDHLGPAHSIVATTQYKGALCTPVLLRMSTRVEYGEFVTHAGNWALMIGSGAEVVCLVRSVGLVGCILMSVVVRVVVFVVVRVWKCAWKDGSEDLLQDALIDLYLWYDLMSCEI
jgi:hypothetical protein